MNIPDNSILILSSFVFLSNVFVATYKKDVVYIILFSVLTITSIIVHTMYDSKNDRLRHSSFEENMNILDKIAIYGIVLYGAYHIYSKYNKYNLFFFLYLSLIVFTFLCCIYVYYYGYTQHKYCFDPNKNTSYIYHAIMHVVSSFGHNMIMLLL